MRLFFRLLARLPLPANHFLGALAGRLVYALSPRYRRRVLDNLGHSGICPGPREVRRLARENAAEIGKGAAELAWALFRSEDAVAKVRGRSGWIPLPLFSEQAKAIGFVDSASTTVPMLETYAYSASKAAVHQLTRHLAKRLAGEHITVQGWASLTAVS